MSSAYCLNAAAAFRGPLERTFAMPRLSSDHPCGRKKLTVDTNVSSSFPCPRAFASFNRSIASRTSGNISHSVSAFTFIKGEISRVIVFFIDGETSSSCSRSANTLPSNNRSIRFLPSSVIFPSSIREFRSPLPKTPSSIK